MLNCRTKKVTGTEAERRAQQRAETQDSLIYLFFLIDKAFHCSNLFLVPCVLVEPYKRTMDQFIKD